MCPGQRVYLVGAPGDFLEERLSEMPPAYEVSRELDDGQPGLLIVWPQGEDGLTALPTGLVDNKVLTFGDEEYGVRFALRRAERGRH